MRKLRRRTRAMIVVATSSVLSGTLLAQSITQNAIQIPVMNTTTISTVKFILPPQQRAITLPLDSPPINGFIPQVVFGLTDQQKDLNSGDFAAVPSLSPGGSTLPKNQTPRYFNAIFDTGASSHIITNAAAAAFNFASAGRTGTNQQQIIGASGSEFVTVTDPIGIYATGFANASSGGGTISVTPGSLKGQWNTSILIAGPGSSLPNLLGVPMAAQYQVMISNSQTRQLSVGTQTIRTPQIAFQTLDTAMPAGFVKMWMGVQSLNGISPDPVFLPDPNSIFNGSLADNPAASTFWASFFAETDLSKGTNTRNDQEFLIDTGAEVSVISEETAAHLGIYTVGPNATTPDFFVDIEGVGGTSTNAPGFYIDSLSVTTNGGPLNWTHVPVVLIDLIDPRDGIGFVPGILGMNLFTDRDLVVNGSLADPYIGIGPQLTAQWANNVSGIWNDDLKWILGVPNGQDSTANFLGAISAPQSISLNGGSFSVGQMTFNNPNRYTINGPGTLTMQVSTGSAQINVLGGSHTINAALTLNSDTVINVASFSSLLTISSDVNAGNVAITKSGAGVLEMKNIRAAALNVNAGTVFVTPDSTSAGAGRVLALNIAGGPSPTAKFDLTNNALVIDYDTISPIAAVRDQLKAAFADGSWTGNGITSSTALGVAADGANHHKTGLGYAEATDVGSPANFFGQDINGAALLLRYTLYGDTNLDGAVNSSDFSTLAANFGQSGKYWPQGDFNYDGVVNSLDMNALSANFGAAAPAPLPGALVPEPAAISLLAAGVLIAGRRRRVTSAFSPSHPARR